MTKKDRPAKSSGDTPASGDKSRFLTASRPELLVDGSDAEFRKLVHAFFAFLARHEAVRSGHAKYIGLAGIEYTILISIGHLTATEGPVSINRLASHLYLSGAFVTTVINRLVKDKLVTKEADPDDGRKVRLKLTDAARERLATLAPAQRQVNDIQFGALGPGDMPRLLAILEGLIDGSDRALKLQEYLLAQSVSDS